MNRDALPLDDDSMPHITVDDMDDLDLVLRILTGGLVVFSIAAFLVAVWIGRGGSW